MESQRPKLNQYSMAETKTKSIISKSPKPKPLYSDKTEDQKLTLGGDVKKVVVFGGTKSKSE